MSCTYVSTCTCLRMCTWRRRVSALRSFGFVSIFLRAHGVGSGKTLKTTSGGGWRSARRLASDRAQYYFTRIWASKRRKLEPRYSVKTYTAGRVNWFCLTTRKSSFERGTFEYIENNISQGVFELRGECARRGRSSPAISCLFFAQPDYFFFNCDGETVWIIEITFEIILS